MATVKIVIDIGTSGTRVLRQGKGIVLDEPSLLLMEKGKITTVGARAKKNASSAQERFLIAPIDGGVIVNSDFAGFMLQTFLARALEDIRAPRITAVLPVQCGITQKERIELRTVAFNAGIGKVLFLPKVIAMADGQEEPVLCLDIGAGKTDIAIVKGGEIIDGITLNLSASIIDHTIMKFVSDAHSIEIDNLAAEDIKEQIASLLEDDQSQKLITIKDDVGELQKVKILAKELLTATAPFYNKIIEETHKLLSRYGEYIKIIATGGGTKITGFIKFFEKKLGHPITLQPCFESMEVLGKMLEKDKTLKKMLEIKG